MGGDENHLPFFALLVELIIFIYKQSFMDNHYIYKLTSPNGKIYIGQTNNLDGRLAEHKSNSKWRKTKLYNSIRKYGWDNFTKEVIGTTETRQNANLL